MKFSSLVKLSKITYKEAFLQGKFDQAGSDLPQLEEKLSKNINYMRNSNLAFKALITIYVSLLTFSPISVYSHLNIAAEYVSIEWVLFTGSMVMGFFFISQFLYILMFGVFQLSGLFSYKPYLWLKTLPLNEKDLQKIGFLTIIRGFGVPSLAICLTLPIATAFHTLNIWIIMLSFVLSCLHCFFFYMYSDYSRSQISSDHIPYQPAIKQI